MRCYDPRRLELLAVLEALEHFKPIISGRKTHLETDHANLLRLRHGVHSNGQLARWAYRLAEFDHELLSHRPGKDMPVADALSRNAFPRRSPSTNMVPLYQKPTFSSLALEALNLRMKRRQLIELPLETYKRQPSAKQNQLTSTHV